MSDGFWQALEQVKTIRFRPLADGSGILPRGQITFSLGQIIFQWHTLEMRATNAPAAQLPP